MLRFADDTYTESYISTIGVDFVSVDFFLFLCIFVEKMREGKQGEIIDERKGGEGVECDKVGIGLWYY